MKLLTLVSKAQQWVGTRLKSLSQLEEKFMRQHQTVLGGFSIRTIWAEGRVIIRSYVSTDIRVGHLPRQVWLAA